MMPSDFEEHEPFGTNGKGHSSPHAKHVEQKAKPLQTLEDLLLPALERVKRRCSGEEKPIPLPWRDLNAHFGGGLWNGLNVLVKGTGVGGTQLCMQVGLHAAHAGFPTVYVGLEMGAFDIGVRAMGLDASVPWSALWTGQAGPDYVARAQESVARLQGLPFYTDVARPMSHSKDAIVSVLEQVRAAHPGETPILAIVDFLQLVGDEPGDEHELRQRVALVAYALREAAVRLSVAVLAISSISRERLKILPELATAAGLVWEEDGDGCPVERRILDPDAIIGLGKESGEIEYSADSVSVIARAAGTWDGSGSDVIFATAKGRATGAMWSPLRFTGYRYDECTDRGGCLVAAWAEAKTKRETAREAKKASKEAAKISKIVADAALVAAYVLAHDGCSVGEARVNALADNRRRWTAAAAVLVRALKTATNGKSTALTIDRSALPSEVVERLPSTSGGQS